MPGSGIKQIQHTGVKAMAWLSLVLFTAAGAAFTDTFISDWVVAGIRMIPYANIVAAVVLVIEVALFIRDIWVDFEPNQQALWVAVTAPTVARMVSGRLSSEVSTLSHRLLAAISPILTGWIGSGAALLTAAVTLAGGIVLAQRTVNGGGRARG